MNNDLISREALKKCARVVFDKDLGRLRVVDVSDIDNAPTVETYTKDDMTREYLKGYNACKDMNNDLISRKWLTDAIRNRRTYLSYEDAKDVIDLIDNAPTVKDVIDLIDNAPTVAERPQGEWIECTKSGMPLTEYGRMTGEKWYGFKCSQCNFIYKGNALIESHFCQKCGAYMRKGGKE